MSSPQSSEAVTDRRRRHVQPHRGATHVALFEHRFEQHQQVEVDAREISFVQHMAEIVSLDSARFRGDLACRRNP